MSEDNELVRLAVDALYSHFDAYGATKRAAYLINNLIEAVVAAEAADAEGRLADIERRLDEIDHDAMLARQAGLSRRSLS